MIYFESNTRKQSIVTHAILLLPLFSFIGCQTNVVHERLESLPLLSGDDRATAKASRYNRKGVDYLNRGKLSKAESHFQKSIELDAKSAAAHNNLGNLLMIRNEHYLAAWEFERAAQLSPNSPEPYVNLGLVFEKVGQLERAEENYAIAMEIAPTNPICIGNLARILVKQDGDPAQIKGLLDLVMLHDSRPDWIDWADHLLSTRYRLSGVPGDSPDSAGYSRMQGSESNMQKIQMQREWPDDRQPLQLPLRDLEIQAGNKSFEFLPPPNASPNGH